MGTADEERVLREISLYR